MIDIPIKKGLAGSTHVKVEAAPATPPNVAMSGAMQHNEEAMAAKSPVPKYVVFIQILIFDSYQFSQKNFLVSLYIEDSKNNKWSVPLFDFE